MKNNTISLRNRFYLAAMLFLLSEIFFIGQSQAAPGSTCTWTAASSNLASDMSNWSGCGTLADSVLLFDGNVTNTGVILDVTASVMDLNTANSYAGIISGTSTTNISVSGNFTINTGSIFNQTAGTFALTGNGATIGGGGSIVFYDLVISQLVNFNTDVTANVLTNNGTINAGSSNITLTGSGDVFVAGIFNAGTGMVDYTGISNVATTTYNVLKSEGTQTLDGDIAVQSRIFVGATGVFTQSSGAVALTSSSGEILNLGSLSLSDLAVVGTTTLYGDITITNALTLNEGNTFINGTAGDTIIFSGTGTPFFLAGGTFLANTSTVRYTGATVDIATTTYYNLQTVGGGSVFTADGNITVNGSQFQVSGATFTQSSGTFTMGTGSVIMNNSGSNINFYNLVNNGVGLSGGSVTTTNIFTNNTTLFTGGAYSVVLTATGTPFVNNGSIFDGNITFSGDTVNIPSTTYYGLTINSGTSATLTGSTTVTNLLTVNSGKTLNVSNVQLTLSGTGTPLVVAGTLVAGTSTVIYSGNTSSVASTTFYNLTLNGATSANFTGTTTITNLLTLNSGTLTEVGVYGYVVLTANDTPFVNNSGAHNFNGVAFKYSGSSVNITPATYFDLMIDSASSTLLGDVLAVDALIINSGKTLNAGTSTISLYGVSTAFTIGGTFNVDTSNIVYNSGNQSGTSTLAVINYSTLTLSGTSATYILSGDVTTTVAFANSGTFDLGDYNLVISSGTYANNGTTTLSGSGVVKKDSSGGFTSDSYTSGTGNGEGNTVTITLVDPTVNLLANSAESKNVTVVASGFSDSETVALTETGVATGIFTGTIPFNIASGGLSNSKLDVSGSGSVTLAYTNGYGALSGAGTSATYSGSTFVIASSGGGSSGSVGTSPVVVLNSGTGVSAAFSANDPQTVVLTFSVTNVSQVAVSEDQNFGAASWETFSSTKQFKLSTGNGAKILYVKFRSASGVETVVYKVIVNVNNGKANPINTEAVTVKTTPAGVTIFNLSDPKSKVLILPVKKLVYAPNSSVAYTYTFKNETKKTLKIKALRQVVDAEGKVVSKVNGTASIAKGKMYKTNVSNVLGSKLADGTYTIVVKVMDANGKTLDENSFDVSVKKPAPVVKKPVAVKVPVKKK